MLVIEVTEKLDKVGSASAVLIFAQSFKYQDDSKFITDKRRAKTGIRLCHHVTSYKGGNG